MTFALGSWVRAQGFYVVVTGAQEYPATIVYEVLDPNGKAINAGFLNIESPSDRDTVRMDLPARFAVQFYEDINGNEELDRGFFTQPLERYGFSNNAWRPLGKPNISEMLIAHKRTWTGITVHLKSVTDL
jgi:uncharacterized protein (DUF2141 family)